MKVYKVIAQTITVDGWRGGKKCLKVFSTKEKALKFKQEWEALWQKHADNKQCVSPCWYDYEKELQIKVVNVD